MTQDELNNLCNELSTLMTYQKLTSQTDSCQLQMISRI